MAKLKLYKKTYKNVEGFIVTDTEGHEFTYTETDIVPLVAEANGIYRAPKGTLYSPVIANISDPTQTHYDDVELNTWEDLVMIGRSGSAPHYLEIGGIINGTYTLTDGTTYDYPWIIVDFQTVELQDGSTYDNVPIIQAQYLGHEDVVFDAPETKIATETTAQSGYYYVGCSGSTYTLLSLSAGDTIPYSDYTTAIYKTLWNDKDHVQYGNSAWALSYLRQYLNNSGTGYWTAQHACDIAPSTQGTGFLTYMPSEMVNALTPIKRTTMRTDYMNNTVDTTYDKFWIASHSEMNFATSSTMANDGAPWAYYKQILNSDTPVTNDTYSAMIRYACNGTTSAQTWWSRSPYIGYYSIHCINWQGYTGNTGPYSSLRVLPCTALI